MVTLALLAGVVLGLLGFRLTQVGGLRFGRPAAQPRPVAARGDLAEDEKGTIDLFREASPSVVYITTLARRIDFWTRNVVEIPQGDGLGLRLGPGRPRRDELPRGPGRGGRRGDARRARQRRRTLVGAAPQYDLAVLRISTSKSILRAFPSAPARTSRSGRRSSPSATRSASTRR